MLAALLRKSGSELKQVNMIRASQLDGCTILSAPQQPLLIILPRNNPKGQLSILNSHDLVPASK